MRSSNLSALIFIQTILFSNGFIGGFYKKTNIDNASSQILKLSAPIPDERWEDGEVPWDFVKPKRKTNGTESFIRKAPRNPVPPIISGEKIMNLVFMLII
jgi:hypothetical protein